MDFGASQYLSTLPIPIPQPTPLNHNGDCVYEKEKQCL